MTTTPSLHSTPDDEAVPLRRKARIDLGRLLMVPLACGLLTLNLLGAIANARKQFDAVALAGALLTALFYAVVIFAYLRRSTAGATTKSWSSHVAAIVATWLPFAFVFLPRGHHGRAIGVLADLLILTGLAWSIWSLSTLGRSFSVLAQARKVVSAGPYRFVRHPVYFGEIAGSLGLTLARPGFASITMWLGLVSLQLFRALHEERVLAANLPAYAAYRLATKRRLIPFLL
ncbi:MAG: isoprenylcysteine carboxylmethyltransferase family protein [Actinomycetota bacterium]